ncbi:hypothetical protein Tsubulata_050221, partial [Turnera subulata]
MRTRVQFSNSVIRHEQPLTGLYLHTGNHSQAKLIGTLVSISGALVVDLYKGPQIVSISSTTTPSSWFLQSLGSPTTNWVIGGLLLAIAELISSIWYIILAQVMRIYPAEIGVMFFSHLIEIFIAAPVCIIAEPNLSAWRLGPDISLVAVIYSGFIGVCYILRTWTVRIKGPVYLAMFKPSSIAVAAFMSFIFLGEALHLGSVIGAIIISVGFYAVLWGKAKEEEETPDDPCSFNTLTPEILPGASCGICCRIPDRMLHHCPPNNVQSSIHERDELLCLPLLLPCNRNACSSSLLLHLPQLPSSKAPLYFRICLLSLFTLLMLMFGLKGLEYSSPTLASVISNLSPAFTFTLAIILSSQAKLVGTLVSISGALVVDLYKGPEIVSISSATTPSTWFLQSLGSPTTNWVIGGALIATEELISSIWYIILAQVMRIYPAEISVMFFSHLIGIFLSAPVCIIAEPNLSAWRLGPDISLVAVIFSGFIGVCYILRTWAVRIKGPVYLAMFKPLSIAVAAFMSFIFLGEALHLGSVIGAIIFDYVEVYERQNQLQKELCLEMAWRHFHKEFLPFAAVMVSQCSIVGMGIIFKAASMKGMSFPAYLLYSRVVSTLFLLPFFFLFPSAVKLPSSRAPLYWRICLLSLITLLMLPLAYKGIEYSSPTLSSAMGNLSPACTFILAIIFRMERRPAIDKSSSQAKIIGTLVTISGALVISLYKGPEIISVSSTKPSTSFPQYSLGLSSTKNWVIGGLLLATEDVLVSIWFIIMAQVMRIYPAEIGVMFFCYLIEIFIAAPVCIIAEPNLSAWRLRPDISLVAVIYAGFNGLCFILRTWAVRVKGPVYIAMFKPLSMAIAAFMSFILLGEALHLGRMLHHWLPHNIQSSIHERDELLSLPLLLPCIRHSCSSPLSLHLPQGLEYSSPTLSSVMSNLSPACTFTLAIILGMERRLSISKSSSQAKLIGTLVSISGALVVDLYKGPQIVSISSTTTTASNSFLQSLGSPTTNWVIGGLMFTIEELFSSIWYIILAQVMRVYPAEIGVMFFSHLIEIFIAAPVCVIAEPNLSAWRLGPDISLVAVVYSVR